MFYAGLGWSSAEGCSILKQSVEDCSILKQSAEGGLQILDAVTCSPYDLALHGFSLVGQLSAMLQLSVKMHAANFSTVYITWISMVFALWF